MCFDHIRSSENRGCLTKEVYFRFKRLKYPYHLILKKLNEKKGKNADLTPFKKKSSWNFDNKNDFQSKARKR